MWWFFFSGAYKICLWKIHSLTKIQSCIIVLYRHDDDQRRGWRRETNEDGEPVGVERTARGRGGRAVPVRSRREDDRDGQY